MGSCCLVAICTTRGYDASSGCREPVCIFHIPSTTCRGYTRLLGILDMPIKIPLAEGPSNTVSYVFICVGTIWYYIWLNLYIYIYAYLDWEITSCQQFPNFCDNFGGNFTLAYLHTCVTFTSAAQVTRKYEKNIGKSSKRHWHERTSSRISRFDFGKIYETTWILE